ncbi:hypothetical protein B0T19DRAFT_217051 [Cercophora scortea]|uniref:Uncharacterized protein n=1 Tax=Cercophora scortea TaxID=314031 RepID=A0AAE0IFR9_9PEZI|nr:hypothetical protein B0T19DRAFT_217051 [Cercophora scortea]
MGRFRGVYGDDAPASRRPHENTGSLQPPPPPRPADTGNEYTAAVPNGYGPASVPRPPELNDPAIVSYSVRRANASRLQPLRLEDMLNDRAALAQYEPGPASVPRAPQPYHPGRPWHIADNGPLLVETWNPGNVNTGNLRPSRPLSIRELLRPSSPNGDSASPARRAPELDDPAMVRYCARHGNVPRPGMSNQNVDTGDLRSSRPLSVRELLRSSPNGDSPRPARRAPELNDPAIVRAAVRYDPVPHRSTNGRDVDTGDLRSFRRKRVEELLASARSSPARQSAPAPAPAWAAARARVQARAQAQARARAMARARALPLPTPPRTPQRPHPIEQAQAPLAKRRRLSELGKRLVRTKEHFQRLLRERKRENSDATKKKMAEAEEAAGSQCQVGLGGRCTLPLCTDPDCEYASGDTEDEDEDDSDTEDGSGDEGELGNGMEVEAAGRCLIMLRETGVS